MERDTSQMTLQQYQTRKLKLLEQNYHLALQALAELEALDTDDRDADWEEFHTMVLRDKNRLETELPLFVIVNGKGQ